MPRREIRRSALPLRAELPLAELAARHGGAVDGAVALEPVSAIAPIGEARFGDLAPLTDRKHLADARRSPAVLLVDASLADRVPEGRRWIHPYARWALAELLEELAPAVTPDRRGDAHVASGARLGADVRVGAGVVIFDDVEIGAGTVLEPNAVVYGRVRIGAGVLVGASAVIGRPGFGWVPAPDGSHRRMPQLAGVVVEDRVEIGPLCTVDAGTLSPTVLRRGVRLDAHVHVGHNVELGPETLVAAQSGFAGSVKVGRGVLIGGQVGVADHVTVGDGARLAAQSGVIGDVPPGRAVAGYPAVDRSRWLRAVARMLRVTNGFRQT